MNALINPKTWIPMGCGLGLRSQHYSEILEKLPPVNWFEAVTENYMDTGGKPLKTLEKIRAHYPIALHGTALSIGSADSLNQKYLERLKRLVNHIDPFIVSDHLCWSGVEGEALHDLLPLPFTEEAVRYVVSRVGQVQEYLGRQILLENVSTYITYKSSVMPEWEFLTQIAKRSGCGILLDLNNIYVNANNHGFEAIDYLKAIPGEYVAQFHLAGHTDMGDFLFDTHSAPIIKKVWGLYQEALKLYGPVSTLIEWDEAIPSLNRLLKEADKAKAIYELHSQVNKKKIPNFSKPPIEIKKPNMDLLRFQKEIRRQIQQKESDAKVKAPSIANEFLNPQGKASGQERLAIYSSGYLARMFETLSETFEALRKTLGDKNFSALCYVYAKRYPSPDYNLNYAGQSLPKFLSTSPLLKKQPYLLDLANLEWKIWMAFHAFDQMPFKPSQVAQIPADSWEDLKIIFQPSVSIYACQWPVLDLWLKRHNKKIFKNLKLKKKQEWILIGRKAELVRTERLDQNQFKLIQLLINSHTLGNSCETLAELIEDPSQLPIANWFSRWVGDGLIQKVQIASKA